MGFSYHKRITIIPKFLYLNINGQPFEEPLLFL
ncbi:hypothetical protein I309_00874 [Cryptococcus deuterogattii LA55]|nr:hypothetical protein I309_00874 [Cryptococcus deuterogattii LA55]KIR37406.1 hypothetical protein I352_00722 [Cryptococcus deuterogattii MMRL2647]KIR75206.1 hypothetical protein I310_01484 [Cryptococcus deuterogattii CA1014]KIR92875.1 hypothetical protein I304_03456 [Cryptococcus deuterogattii CBS 10090]KIR98197.1 hypothetical protein L804_04659 [Cryptococcus deuterogattii 2001/935-1]